MARVDLGRKINCHDCGTKYYTLNRPEPRCPRCGAEPAEEQADPVVRMRSRRRATTIDKPERKKKRRMTGCRPHPANPHP